MLVRARLRSSAFGFRPFSLGGAGEVVVFWIAWTLEGQCGSGGGSGGAASVCAIVAFVVRNRKTPFHERAQPRAKLGLQLRAHTSLSHNPTLLGEG